MNKMTDEELVRALRIACHEEGMVEAGMFTVSRTDTIVKLSIELLFRLKRGRKAMELLLKVEQRAANNLDDRETVYTVYAMAHNFNLTREGRKIK